MANPSEAIVMGALLLVVLAAAGFYFYSRLAYTEKRLGFMETILMDIKLAMEQEEELAAAAMAAAGGKGSPAGAYAPAPYEPSPPVPSPPSSEEKEQQFYASILKSVEEVAPIQADSEGVQGTRLDTLEATVGSLFPGEATTTEAEPVAVATVPVAVESVNYDSMSKKDLESLAEKKGIRVPKRAGRAEIISLLRRTETVASSSEKQEESTSAPTSVNVEGSLLASAGNTDGEFAVDLGQPSGSAVDAEEVGF